MTAQTVHPVPAIAEQHTNFRCPQIVQETIKRLLLCGNRHFQWWLRASESDAIANKQQIFRKSAAKSSLIGIQEVA